MERLTLTITGLVHGVGMRYQVRQYARSHGLSGWVRNNPDGSVSVVAEASRDRLQTFLDWCYTGVRSAQIDAIDAVWGETDGSFGDFSIISPHHNP